MLLDNIRFYGQLVFIHGKPFFLLIFYYEVKQLVSKLSVISLLILLIEYPRGCKKNGKLNERKYQSYLAKFYVNYGTRLYTNYFFRFLLYVLLSIPCLLTLSTLLGGLNLIVTSMLYLIVSLFLYVFFKKKLT